MKSRISCLLISLLACAYAWACGIPSYNNVDLRIYRAVDPSQPELNISPNKKREENLQLWLKAVGGGCTKQEIAEVVYKYPLDSLHAVSSNSDNAFARLLAQESNAQLRQCLLLAKEVETLRDYMNDPWYYSVPDDREHQRLDSLLQLCLQHMDGRLAPRYSVQALRIMLQQNSTDSMVAFWDKYQAALPENVLKEMCREYVGGAYYRMGNMDRAFETYIPLIHTPGNSAAGNVYEMQMIYPHDPNHPLLRENAQAIIHGLEDKIKYYANYDIDSRANRSDSIAADSVYLELRDFALAAARNPRVKHPGFWHYTAAVLYYLDNDDAHARQQAALAAVRPMTPYDRESLRALNLLLDLERGYIDPNRLCADLQWLQSKMAAELDTIADRETASWNLSVGYSVGPWTDIMRKVCSVGGLRLIHNGNTTLGLQLSNYGYFMPYRMIDGNISNAEHYSNDFFRQMDSIGSQRASAFAMRVLNPQDALDRTLHNGGRFDTDYICDHVGTLYLRERNYAQAAKWLSRVSSAYQTKMNANDYMVLDPFRWLDRDIRIGDNSDYKLRFAQEMLRLEQTIAQSKDANRRALAKIRYAMGMRNSFGRCWALTYYYFNGYPDRDEPDDYSQPRYSASRSAFRDYPAALEVYPICDRLIAEALDEFTNDELKANALLAMKNFKTVVEEMPNTQAARYVRSHCDKYYDYAVHRK